MVGFMETNNIPAGALAVMRNREVVFERAYGWQDESRTRPLRPDVMMRLASVTKPFTAACVRQLIVEGAFTLDTPVCDLGQPGGGLLQLTPHGTPDDRLGSVTVQHCLEHRGGWDRDLVGDLTYMERTIAAELGVPNPPGRTNVVRYIMGQPLQYDPGSTYAYSNIGYLLLGLIVEQATGKPMEENIHARILAPHGILDSELELGRTFREDQNPREPWYSSPGIAWNVFYPENSPQLLVSWPYGGWHHEARVGQGGMVASPRAVLAYLDNFIVSGDSIGIPRSHTESSTWRRNHTGSLNGVNTLARQRGDGINFVVFFNQRPDSGASYSAQMRSLLDAVLDAQTTWPTGDPADAPPAAPILEILREPGGPGLRWFGEPGRHYILQSRSAHGTWMDTGLWQVGSGAWLETHTQEPTAPEIQFQLEAR